jgi:hypothetical protein
MKWTSGFAEGLRVLARIEEHHIVRSKRLVAEAWRPLILPSEVTETD